ncbi:MAG TPA: hypothetical protein ENK94_01455 [Campylobacterales bacterium]|nr:hypothetical protein [Campylobacterales bacterium]
MKKIVFMLALIPIVSLAGLNLPKINKTLSGISSNKTISYYNANNLIDLRGTLNLTSKHEADIILFSEENNQNKITIVNSYKKLKKNKNSIGAIYLKKGRTQIVFVKERLDKHNLHLKQSFRKHLIHEWQLNRVSILKKIK